MDSKSNLESGNIRALLKYYKIHYNEDAVILLTKQRIPLYVRVIASLGKTFNHVVDPLNVPLFDMYMCMETVLDRCDCYETAMYTSRNNDRISGLIDKKFVPERKYSKAQLYIQSLHHFYMQI